MRKEEKEVRDLGYSWELKSEKSEKDEVSADEKRLAKPRRTEDADGSAETHLDDPHGGETETLFDGVPQRIADIFSDATSADDSATAADGDWRGDSVHMRWREGLEMRESGGISI